ncbi:MAG: tRNA uridine(34) 5-carboxymethylaminomethyl modification radical SAM/GNAT enzyme Elp3 [Candidatus Nealsonbacteria bacterium]|nr:tRNA uridine(34) 5-carboxymethylaminomethyl modification radical SAM/GNAT enzyme Elp3 [Candidatus Nealsonbacteria bacterium]
MDIKYAAIKELAKAGFKTRESLESFKRKVSAKYGIPLLTNTELLKEYHNLVEKGMMGPSAKLENLLKTRGIRSLSGIIVVSVLTRPYPCGGKCLFCPTQKGVPKSYLDGEPAVMRALANKFDPYLQVQNRLKALENTGHPIDKIDLRIIGGTWSYNPKKYQTWFIKRCFEACNDYDKKQKTKNKKLQLKTENLEKLQKANENAKCRIIGVNVETRPDYIDIKEIKRLRKLGVTRVELGVQSTYDNVLDLNNRGHKIDATIKATKLLKDAGFKICYQMMPNLPGSNLEKDEKMFEELFQNLNFQPDQLKIYPCALLKEAPLYWVKDKIGYKPYNVDELRELLKEAKKKIPYYCRIQRVIRDIPSTKITEGGAKAVSLRQDLAKDQIKEGWRCKCIRCREVKGDYNPKEKIYLFRENYEASGGREIFLSFENKSRTKLFSLLRLRVPAEVQPPLSFQTLKDSAIIREIQTYGQVHPIGQGPALSKSPQHKGLGKKLMKEAEKIAKQESGLKKIAVIAGVGARPYFRKLGYQLKDTYMVKRII